jgi:CyaY protein
MTIATRGRPSTDTLITLSSLIRGILVSPSSPSSPAARVQLTDADYMRECTVLLARIEAACDRWLQADVIDIDTHRTGGLLELALPDHSKIVINMQPPLHEMWVAARGGGFHYQWDGQCWRDTRDGHELLEMLSRQASAQGGKALKF